MRDDTDRIIGFKHYGPTGTYYVSRYYEFNAQGDVVALYDGNGVLLGKYAYDSWGKLLSVTDPDGNALTSHADPVVANPIRYRGYYYDTETGFYYLNSRYYDPETRRFVNADKYLSTGQGFIGFNMYAYCGNNPVLYSDLFGLFYSEVPLTEWTGYLTSVDYAARDIYFKTDANNDGVFDYNDVNQIIRYYHCDKNDVYKELLSVGGLSPVPVSDNSTNYNATLSTYNSRNERGQDINDEQIQKTKFWVGASCTVVGKIASKIPHPAAVVVGEIAEKVGYCLMAWDFIDLYLLEEDGEPYE